MPTTTMREKRRGRQETQPLGGTNLAVGDEVAGSVKEWKSFSAGAPVTAGET